MNRFILIIGIVLFLNGAQAAVLNSPSSRALPPPAGIWPQDTNPLTGNDASTRTFEAIGSIGLTGGQATGSDHATSTFESIGFLGLTGGQAIGTDQATTTFETIGPVNANNGQPVGTGD